MGIRICIYRIFVCSASSILLVMVVTAHYRSLRAHIYRFFLFLFRLVLHTNTRVERAGGGMGGGHVIKFMCNNKFKIKYSRVYVRWQAILHKLIAVQSAKHLYPKYINEPSWFMYKRIYRTAIMWFD